MELMTHPINFLSQVVTFARAVAISLDNTNVAAMLHKAPLANQDADTCRSLRRNAIAATRGSMVGPIAYPLGEWSLQELGGGGREVSFLK